MSPDLTKQVQFSINRMARESAMHFCRLAQHGDAEFVNVTYPTGLKTVIAFANSEKAEVELRTAKALRANGYKVTS